MTHIATAMVLLALFPLTVGYLVLLERKVLADLQARLDLCASVRMDCYSPLPTH